MSITLHQRIRSDIEAKILSGEWLPGYRIPFEHELMDTYQCSRMTVNKVMTGLAEAGLIERRRRAGSFVARPLAQSAVLHIPDIQAEITQRGDSYDYRLLSRSNRTATKDDMEKLQSGSVKPGKILDLRCLHLARGKPFALEERLMNLAVVPDVSNEPFKETPPGTWLLHHVPWTEAEHRIYAVPASAEKAELLDIPANSSCLVVERRTWRADETITFARLTYPGNLYQMIARFTPTR